MVSMPKISMPTFAGTAQKLGFETTKQTKSFGCFTKTVAMTNKEIAKAAQAKMINATVGFGKTHPKKIAAFVATVIGLAVAHKTGHLGQGIGAIQSCLPAMPALNMPAMPALNMPAMPAFLGGAKAE